MMYSWTFSARMVDDLARLLRAMQKHRYLLEVDHRIHWLVDEALSDLPLFEPAAARFRARRAEDSDLDVRSREPTLWRKVDVDTAIAALTAFWDDSDAGDARRERLLRCYEEENFEVPTHDPFDAPREEPPHPELILLDWVFFPVDELDADRHAGALGAMEKAEEEVDASAAVYVEGPSLAAPELCFGAREGLLLGDFDVWATPPYSYVDYVFRGVSKAAKLLEPPVGYEDE